MLATLAGIIVPSLNVVELSVNGAAGAAASLMPQLASTTAPAVSRIFFMAMSSLLFRPITGGASHRQFPFHLRLAARHISGDGDHVVIAKLGHDLLHERC